MNLKDAVQRSEKAPFLLRSSVSDDNAEFVVQKEEVCSQKKTAGGKIPEALSMSQ